MTHKLPKQLQNQYIYVRFEKLKAGKKNLKRERQNTKHKNIFL